MEETRQMRALMFRFIRFVVHGLCTRLLRAADVYLIGNSPIGFGGFAAEGVSRRWAFPIYKPLLFIIIRKSHI